MSQGKIEISGFDVSAVQSGKIIIIPEIQFVNKKGRPIA
jgi:hypothetical protein